MSPSTGTAPKPPAAHRRRDWSVHLTTLAGIDIRMHLSFLLLVALVAVSESRPGGLGLAGGLIWLAVIFTCVLIHELAHSIVGRARGARVDSIVLLPIGGVSRMTRMPTAWSDELAIAVVGPLASFGLGLLAAMASLALGEKLLPVNLYSGALLPRTAWLNLLLGAFNLVPAFPLDGGRVLRSLLERRMPPEEATQRAATVGKVLGAALALIGLLWNFWFVIIGVFIMLGAASEQSSATAHARLRGVPARRLARVAAVLETDEPVGDIERFAVHGQEQFPVTSGGHYAGLVERSALGGLGPGVRAGDVADVAAPALGADEDLGASGLDRLVESGYPALAVVNGAGEVVGLLGLEDIAAFLGGPGADDSHPWRSS